MGDYPRSEIRDGGDIPLAVLQPPANPSPSPWHRRQSACPAQVQGGEEGGGQPRAGGPNLREQSRSGHPSHIHDNHCRFHGQHDLQHSCPSLIRHRGRPRGVLRLRPHRPLGPPGALRLRPVVGIEGQVAGRGGWDHPHGAQAVVGCSHHEFSQTRPSRGRTGHPNHRDGGADDALARGGLSGRGLHRERVRPRGGNSPSERALQRRRRTGLHPARGRYGKSKGGSRHRGAAQQRQLARTR